MPKKIKELLDASYAVSPTKRQFRFLGTLLASQTRVRAALGIGREARGGQEQPRLCKGNA